MSRTLYSRLPSFLVNKKERDESAELEKLNKTIRNGRDEPTNFLQSLESQMQVVGFGLSISTLAVNPPLAVVIFSITMLSLQVVNMVKNNVELVDVFTEVIHVLKYISNTLDVKRTEEHIIYIKKHLISLLLLISTIKKILSWRRFTIAPNSLIQKILREVSLINSELIIELDISIKKNNELLKKHEELIEKQNQTISLLDEKVTKIESSKKGFTHLFGQTIKKGGTTDNLRQPILSRNDSKVAEELDEILNASKDDLNQIASTIIKKEQENNQQNEEEDKNQLLKESNQLLNIIDDKVYEEFNNAGISSEEITEMQQDDTKIMGGFSKKSKKSRKSKKSKKSKKSRKSKKSKKSRKFNKSRK
jgi:hypothetical protein